MKLNRDRSGVWTSVPTQLETERQPDFIEAFPRYLTLFDPVFEKAQSRNEFEFIMTLLGIRGLQDAGWNPYETTLRAIAKMERVHNDLDDFESSRHLKLWIYGHIVEASEPYELLANLLDLAAGGRYRIARFPNGKNGQPQSPGKKIELLATQAAEVGMPGAMEPLSEIWNRELRNAIFHSDYAFHGHDVRLPGASQIITGDDLEQLTARAAAYHHAMAYLRQVHLASYDEPKVISAQPFAPPPERAMVIVRVGAGAVGLKDALTSVERAAGAIPFRMAVGTPEELKMLQADPDLALLPARENTVD